MTEDELTTTFAAILKADDIERAAKRELDQVTARVKSVIAEAQFDQEKAWVKINAHMAETGEYEIILPHDPISNWRIYPTTPRESVTGDADAAPDEFVTRSLKKAEVAKHLKARREANEPELNWARMELGESKLTYRLERVK